MKLINLRLADEPWAICLEAEGQVWDVHNLYDFVELHHNIVQCSVSLHWQPTRYGVISEPTPAFAILFEGVEYFEVTPRDPEIPDYGEDLCLNGVSRVPVDDDTRTLIDQGIPQKSDFPDETFHLWFAFRSGQHIRVGAKTATFRQFAQPTVKAT